MTNRETALLMFNEYTQLRIELFKLLNDSEMITFYAMTARITLAEELAEYGGNLLITDNEKEIAILDKMVTINAAIKINDVTYKINPRFGCCVKTCDEDPESTALAAIDLWDKMQKIADDAIIDQWDDYLAKIASDYQLDRYVDGD